MPDLRRPEAGRFFRRLLWLPALLSCSEVPGHLPSTWQGELLPVSPGLVTGSVAAVSQFGRTEAAIQILRGDTNTAYLWRIEAGSCPEGGEIQGGRALYPELTTGEAGSATARTVLSRELAPGASYAARVLRSQGGEERLAACGELLRTR